MSDPDARTGPWRTAVVVGMRDETPRARTLRLALAEPLGHRAGQHVVVRLTAPDGYTASRSYSVASAPDPSPTIELTVERLADGEVSGFLHDVVEVGDELELRGPIGSHFAWDADRPALLVGGGSGLVPLMAMLRHARALGREDLVRVVVGARTLDDLLYRDELPGPGVTIALSRADGPDGRRAGRLRPDDLAPALRPGAVTYLCGSSGFVDAAGRLLVDLGVDAATVRVERFGPTSG